MIKPSPATANSVGSFQGVKWLSRHKRADKPGPFIPRPLDPLPAASSPQIQRLPNPEQSLKMAPSESRKSPPSTGSIRPRFGGSNGARFVSLDKGPIDDALQLLRLVRHIAITVGGFSAALALARASDLIASVPERHTGNLRLGMHSFPLPLALPAFTVSMLWHPRLHEDPAHRWLRGCVRDVCGRQFNDSSVPASTAQD